MCFKPNDVVLFQKVESAYWAPDGVHPSPAGHALIADAWMRTVGALRIP